MTPTRSRCRDPCCIARPLLQGCKENGALQPGGIGPGKAEADCDWLLPAWISQDAGGELGVAAIVR